MFHYVYVLENLDSRLYIGYYPNSVKERLAKHNNGEVFSTKSFRPWKLIFFEGYLNKNDALRREKYLKTSSGSRALKIMLKEYREIHKK